MSQDISASTRPHPYCRTDEQQRTSLYFSRLRTWFRDKLIPWVTVREGAPPVVAREVEEGGYHSGYLVYDDVYDAEYILATWESAIGIHLLDLRIAPNFPPPILLSAPPQEVRADAHLTSTTSPAASSPKPTPYSTPVHPAHDLPAEASALGIAPSEPNPDVVFGAPYHSQPYAHVTPRRLTCSSSGSGTQLPDRYEVFRVLRQFGPVRTLTQSFEGSGGSEGAANVESESSGEKKKRKAGCLDSGVREWTVDVNYWFEEDAERLQREWDGTLCGWRAEVSVPEWWGGLPEWAGDDVPRTPYCRPPPPVTED